VNGDDAEPLYQYLKEQKGFAGWDPNHKLTPILEEMLSKEDPDYKEKSDIKWNFTKFLINKQGQVVARFEPTEDLGKVAKQIEELL
jgi:glutathione peroxidase